MYNYESLGEINNLGSLAGIALAIIGIIFLIAIAYLVFYIVCQWKLFKKAGKEGWEAIVPFYSTFVLVQIAGLNWWYFLIAIAGSICVTLRIDNYAISTVTNIAGYAVNFFVFYNLAKKMHKDPIKTAILGTLFPYVILPLMALSNNYQYDSTVTVNPNGPIGDYQNKNSSSNNSNTSNTTEERFCLGCGAKLRPGTAFCENCGKKVE